MAALTFDDITAPKPPPPTQQGSVVDFSDLAPATAATTASRNFRTSTGAPQPGQQTNDWKPVTWTGTGKAAATGGRNLAEGTVALAGDVPGMAGGVTGWLANKLGVKDAEGYGKAAEEGVRSAIDPLAKIHAVAQLLGYKDSDIPGPSRLFPTSGDIASVTDPAVTAVSPTAEDWTRHRAENPVEGITQGAVEFGPGMLTGRGEAGLTRRFLTRTAAPAVGGEVGGEVGKALGNETLGRLIGSAGMSVVPGVGRRVVSGAPVTGERGDLARYLLDQGVDLTAGDIRGGGRKFLESGLFGGKPGALADEQKTQFNRAALRPAGITADNAGTQVMEQAQHNFDTRYDDIVARNNGVPLDNQLLTDLVNTTDNFHNLKSLAPNAPSIVNNYLQKISNAVQGGGGIIQPDVFRTLRNDITRSITESGDFETKNALRGFRDHMYDAIGRNGQPDVVADLQQTNRQYRNFKIIEKAMTAAGADTSLGNVSPARLRGAVQGSEGSAGYTQGRGDLNELARAGDVMLKDVPNSGTPGRAGPMFISAGLAHAMSQAMSGDWGSALMTAGGAVGPGLARQVVTSGPVRRMAVNNMLNPQPMVDPVVQALLARQAASLSGGGQ
jgi:hypothetical protein